MAAKKLASNVYVDGVLYTPESDVPAEVAKQITNPKAWGESPEPEADKAPAKKAAPGKSADKSD